MAKYGNKELTTVDGNPISIGEAIKRAKKAIEKEKDKERMIELIQEVLDNQSKEEE